MFLINQNMRLCTLNFILCEISSIVFYSDGLFDTFKAKQDYLERVQYHV